MESFCSSNISAGKISVLVRKFRHFCTRLNILILRGRPSCLGEIGREGGALSTSLLSKRQERVWLFSWFEQFPVDGEFPEAVFADHGYLTFLVFP